MLRDFRIKGLGLRTFRDKGSGWVLVVLGAQALGFRCSVLVRSYSQVIS